MKMILKFEYLYTTILNELEKRFCELELKKSC